MKIKSKDYFNSKIKWNKNYEIIVIKTPEDVKKMISYFTDFINKKSKKNL